jgi:hypothetical protein
MAAEASSRTQQRIREDAERRLREVADQAGITGLDSEAIAQDVAAWLPRHKTARDSRADEIRRWDLGMGGGMGIGLGAGGSDPPPSDLDA